MISEYIERLAYLCNKLPYLLSQIDENEFVMKPSRERWSKKEILGHLIDSATNNHQRFVKAQFEDTPFITYNQDKWVEFSYYNKIPTAQLISFWTFYNLQLIELVANIPPDLLQKTCKTGVVASVSLEFIVEDYVIHLEHHLKQLVSY